MLTIYTRYKSNITTQKAKMWCESYGIDYKMLYPKDISKEHIREILRLSDGVYDILLSWNKSYRIWQYLGITKEEIEELSIDELIRILISYPRLLKSLILFDHKHILTGYHDEKIRVFLPRGYRQLLQF
jgi:regulatory protein spx